MIKIKLIKYIWYFSMKKICIETSFLKNYFIFISKEIKKRKGHENITQKSIATKKEKEMFVETRD